jgi:TPP-dependent trihydroxycyclohexane-1,2-dione (THcHDO) dehydratase
MEYGFSCMGYEIAGGIGVKMAPPDKEVVVMVGDGSYMMMNSELATSVSLGQKLIVVVLDNHGFGCINRLQMATGGANFNNLWQDCDMAAQPDIDFRKHAESMGANRRQGVVDRRSRSRSRRPRRRPHHGHRHRDASADHHRSRRLLVGRRRSGRRRRGRRSARGRLT